MYIEDALCSRQGNFSIFLALDRDKALAEILRTLRKERGMSQEKLAERADMHWTYSSMLERSRCKPTVSALFRLADALGINASEILRKAELLCQKRHTA